MLGSQGRAMPAPSYMSEDQMGQQSHVSPSIQARRALFGGSRSGECPVVQEEDSRSVPAASYLKDLRANKPRPIGSRPPPPSRFGTLRRTETEKTGTTTSTNNERPPLPQTNSMPTMVPQSPTQHRLNSAGRNSPFAGRPLARTPSAITSTTTSSVAEKEEGADRPARSRPQSAVYMEQGTRWMEKQEAQSLRTALEDMDLAEEQKIHKDAQDEAAELVWKHRNPDSPFANPNAPYMNPDLKKDYNSHLRKGSYSRSHTQEAAPRVSTSTRGSIIGSQRPSLETSPERKRTSVESPSKLSQDSTASPQQSRKSSGKHYGDLAAAVKNDIETARRRTSSGSRRILSGEKKVFMDPNDKIYEDPQEEPTPPKKQQPPMPIPDLRPAPVPVQSAPSLIRKNPFARVRGRFETPEHAHSAPVLPRAATKHDRVEIQRNPPSQSRRAGYTSNEPLPSPPVGSPDLGGDDEVSPKVTPTRNGKEIRSDDIRAATSKQRSDRSANLPQPTAVSDRLGRPIVSFDQGWKQHKEVVLEETRVPSTPSSPGASTPPRQSRVPDSPRSSPFNRQAIPRIDPPWDSAYRAPPSPSPTNSTFKPSSPMPPIPTIVVPDDPSIQSNVLPEEPEAASMAPAFQSAPSINIEPPRSPSKRVSTGSSGMQRFTPPPLRPTSTVAPSINVDPPVRSPRPSVPSIGVSGPGFSTRPIPSLPPSNAPPRPLPTPTQQPPQHFHANTAPVPKSKPHYTPTLRQSRALCVRCNTPIAGRVLQAAGQRLHPSCFNCHECDTNLEHVAFHPEPESKRSARLERIEARQTGLIPEHLTVEELYNTEETDGDPTLRFYCALDFHELFSPRCKSCKTPIEGEVIVACGAEWHAGHFFCAQCGDPFDASTPFVEKDGYAWCCDCHTHRYSAKCRKCRKPVTDVVVKALGSEWHANCFCCLVSLLCLIALLSVALPINADFTLLAGVWR